MTALPTPPPARAPIVQLPAPGSDAQPEAPDFVVKPLTSRLPDSRIRLLLVEELERVASHVAGLVAPDEQIKLAGVAEDGRTALERVAADKPDVVVIDVLLQGEIGGLEVARRLRAAGTDTPILFITVADRPLTLTHDLGLADVLTLPFGSRELLAAVRNLHEAHRGPVMQPPSGTVAVFSAAGGVGKTAIAHNLAVAFMLELGTRAALFEGDQAHGDMRLHLDAPLEAPSLMQLPTGHATDADLVPLLWQEPAGVDVLLAPPRMEQAEMIMLADIRRAMGMLRRAHDVLVVDTPTVMDDTTLAILDDADVVIDVNDAHRASLLKTERCHAVLMAAEFPMGKVIRVANHARGASGFDAGSAPHAQPDAVLPFDPVLAADELAGRAVASAHPDAQFARGITGLARLVATRLQGQEMGAGVRAA